MEDLDMLPANRQPISLPSRQVLMSEQKPTAKWITARVLSLLGHYFQIPSDPSVAKMMVADWIEDLGDIPQEAVEKATREWRRSSPSRRPSPGDIRQLALKFCVIERKSVEQDEPNIKPISQDRMREIAQEMGMQDSPFVAPMIRGASND